MEKTKHELMLDDLADLTEKLGRVPVRRDYANPRKLGRFSEKAIRIEFGSWGAFIAALKAHVATRKKDLTGEPPVRDPGAFIKLTHPEISSEKLTDEQRSERISAVILECANALKIKPQAVSWPDFQDYTKYAYGKNNAGITPRDITSLGGFNSIRDAYFPPMASPLGLERQRIKEHAQLNRRLGAVETRIQYNLERIEEFASRVFRGRVELIKPHFSGESQTNRIIVAVLSDLHFGSDLLAEETGCLDFGRVEEARRLAQVTKEICEYKIQYRADTELELLVLGDIFRGELHKGGDIVRLAEQQCRSIHLLVQCIAQCAANFKRIRVRFATGNHGRMLQFHHDRATFQKWNSHETVVYYAVMQACANLKNVEFFLPKTPYVTFDLFGKRGIATHGDTVLKPGNPGKAIKTGSIEDQINRINASLPDVEEYALVVVGHVHTPWRGMLGNGTWFIANGPLIPTDDFAVSIGHFETACGMQIFEAVPGYPVGDGRLIQVSRAHDSDASLDQIIKPWPGFSPV